MKSGCDMTSPTNFAVSSSGSGRRKARLPKPRASSAAQDGLSDEVLQGKKAARSSVARAETDSAAFRYWVTCTDVTTPVSALSKA